MYEEKKSKLVCIVKREKKTVHKEQLFSTRRDFNKHYQELLLGLSNWAEREQWFDHKVPGKYSFICFLITLLPAL